MLCKNQIHLITLLIVVAVTGVPSFVPKEGYHVAFVLQKCCSVIGIWIVILRTIHAVHFVVPISTNHIASCGMFGRLRNEYRRDRLLR